MGAGMAITEMVASNSLLWGSEKTRRRANHDGEVEPIAVQIAGADPQMLAEAARYNVDRGAQIIDINMGCPAKKVCNVMAGSALLKDEPLVGRIVSTVVAAVDVPVTLKIGRAGTATTALAVAEIAETPVRCWRSAEPRLRFGRRSATPLRESEIGSVTPTTSIRRARSRCLIPADAR
jgi:tRNA-dihydrouridine synthase B